MPRSYIVQDEHGTKIVNGSDNAYSSAESTILGNTDFDAIYNPITAFNFVLEVEGVYFLPIKSVRAFTKENEFEYIREGGVNDYVHLKRKPISKPFTFQIERYCGTERFLDPLANGTELILPLLLYVYRHKSRAGLSESAPKWPARVYTFTGCTVMSKEYGELNAEKPGLLTETTTISYRELVVLTNPFQSGSELEEWKFKENASDKKGNVTNKYAAVQTYDKPGDSNMYTTSFDEKTGMYKVISKDSNKLTKKFWNGSTVKPSWAKEATPDANNSTYTENTDADGKKHIKRVDHQEFNKPMWDGQKGTTVAWAKQSTPDKTGQTYKSSVEKGVTTITRMDSGDFNRPAYEIGKDKEKPKYAQVAPKDRDAAAPIYKKTGDTIKRVDTSDENKEAYTMSKDMQKPKWAKEPANNNKKPVERPPYDIKYDGADAKYAKTSSKDKPLATPVTWPPTRRAMMAENLKK